MTTKNKTITEHLKSAGSYSAPAQAMGAAFGIILSYHNPEMPLEVILAYVGIFAFVFNMAYLGVVKFVEYKYN